MRGFFISFEGGEGAGKSTQISRLAEHLTANGFDVVTTREPGGSEGAEALRHVLLSGAARLYDDGDMEPVLFAAARADHVANVIGPALAAGRTVICDRFHDSTRVYQGSTGVDAGFLQFLESATIGSAVPDLTIILDVPVEIGLERAGRRRGNAKPDRFEADALGIQERRRERFLEIATQEPQRCVVVDGSRPAEEVAKEIGFIVDDRLDNHRLERTTARQDRPDAILPR